MPAYALRAEFEDTFVGATLNAGPNGESLDTLSALKEGNGVIVVSENDRHAIDALEQHPQFKSVAVPEEVEPVELVDYDAMTVAELRALLPDDADKSGTKTEIIDRLRSLNEEA